MAEQRIGELFCGAGGLGLGAHLAQVESPDGARWFNTPLWGIDNNQWACNTYANNLHANVLCDDVNNIDFEALRNQHGPIDGLLFGFPCNDYSLVGEHRGLDGQYGPLYTNGIRAIQANHPRWFLAENVSGLASANEGEALARILTELNAEGYRLTAHLFRFENYGVPQMRHRFIIVGIRNDVERIFNVPAPTHSEGGVGGLQPWKSASEALEGLEKKTPNNELTNHPDRTVRFLEAIPPGENAWYEGIPEHLRLNVKGYKMSGIYRRLHPDRPAPTVTARGGGGTHGYHWAVPRALTSRERARLQTFPDWFVFDGPKGEVRAQVGMAVPPEGARVVIEAILKTLAGIPYASIPANWLQPDQLATQVAAEQLAGD